MEPTQYEETTEKVAEEREKREVLIRSIYYRFDKIFREPYIQEIYFATKKIQLSDLTEIISGIKTMKYKPENITYEILERWKNRTSENLVRVEERGPLRMGESFTRYLRLCEKTVGFAGWKRLNFSAVEFWTIVNCEWEKARTEGEYLEAIKKGEQLYIDMLTGRSGG